MPRLIWSPAALRDVERLYRFLADKNPEAARRAAKSIREGMPILRDQPGVTSCKWPVSRTVTPRPCP